MRKIRKSTEQKLKDMGFEQVTITDIMYPDRKRKTTNPNEFGTCRECGDPLSPSWIVEDEWLSDNNKNCYKTGRTRRNINYLRCERCGHKELVDDDSFAGEWR